ncbi:HEPN/Toprim-associated domain-containing protein [Intestinibacter bartlettii]|uniref:HEPN/Toprim N-terminal domain-containing protein n=1 Tax=Intestinibacter bartlettii TaxID=261299 RepID=A0ABS6DXG8_9FIRM|nr:hypothetical protein [Intestinibacter bartlettii]
MDAYSRLYINDYQLLKDKNDVQGVLVSIFSENDKTIDEKEVKGNKTKQIRYILNTKKYSDKLDIMGFTLQNAEAEFYKIRKECTDLNKDLEKIEFNDIDFGALKQVIKFIIDNKIYNENDLNKGKMTALDEYKLSEEMILFILKNKEFSCHSNLIDSRFILRIILSIYDKKDDYIIYDVSEIVESGDFEEGYEFSKKAKEFAKLEYIINEKIIVLTEGMSDACILEKSLNILYPHLSEYYSFLDFKATRLRGSADALVSTIKAFISSGIANRTIAIFDNDTAGQEAMKLLSGIEIPNNIKVFKYPDLEIAKKYPTKGPTGDVVMDINGMACSIELYLGKDILCGEDGNLIPIQWIGYFESAGKYQGRILDKANCLKKFFEKITDKNISRENFDFSGIDSILNMIFRAFN